MKVVVIGGGVIASKLLAVAPEELEVSTFTVRDLSNGLYSIAEIVEKCRSADRVIYLAYHHRDLPLNIRLLFKVVSSLAIENWRGVFIFFNTQSALANKILINKKPIRRFFCFDLYTSTKQIQSWILSRYLKKINISEVYLPVVLGPGTKAQIRYEYILAHKIIHLPDMGKNQIAYIKLKILLAWFWRDYFNSLSKSALLKDFQSFFVYEDQFSFSEMLNSLSACRHNHDNLTHGDNLALQIINCDYRYRFSDNWLSNFFYSVKMTPIWLLLSVLRNLLKKATSHKWGSENINIPAVGVDKIFSPIGSEYQFFSSSIDLGSIPIRKIRITK